MLVSIHLEVSYIYGIMLLTSGQREHSVFGTRMFLEREKK